MKQGEGQGRLEAWEAKGVFEFACALTGHWGATQGGCAADDVDGWTLADGSATCAPTKPAAQRVAGSAIVFNKKKEKNQLAELGRVADQILALCEGYTHAAARCGLWAMGHQLWAIGQVTGLLGCWVAGSLGPGRQLLPADGTEIATTYLCTRYKQPGKHSDATALPTCPSPKHVTIIIIIIITTTTRIQAQPCRLKFRVRPIAVGDKHSVALVVQASATAMACAQPSEGLYD
ncbi:hypothetical protein COCMIDRAFT_28722 [Bipolaris oryzae ATCC 44560]|uniref:Uncharacterized protein n=1 Tax=Bipolaris oryzae ATCC 44560 TaxID=930090 RepID=W6YTD3_COCMI|nr:uncharacterized protein COCMIDRAFT_28722 [Bipolaris oryzae ATCC 44560]EUC42702.1 hypothetical protein COCMIDRAFT_28722 [Bipolaris oryzae ATCC 44560]